MNILDTFRNTLKFTAVHTDKPNHMEAGMYIPITKGTAHIWSVQYTDLACYYPILSSLPSMDEVTRAAGFKKPVEARRYILRHAMVRAILGHYLDQEPAESQFIRATTGKPYLDPKANVQDIRFSLSHTDTMICLGISQKSEIGLDIVKIDPHYPFFETGQYLFSPDERRWIAQTAPEGRLLRFFRIWSLKEALLKATGSSVNMMKEAEVSGIMTGHFLDGFYPVHLGKKEMRFFIHESGFSGEYHCTLATIPVMETRLN